VNTPLEFLREQAGIVQPRLAFDAAMPLDMVRWQRDLRLKLRELLGLDLMQAWRCDPSPEADEPEDMGDYTRRRMTLQTAPDYRMPLYVLTPNEGDGPFDVVLAMHGHNYGKRDVCGIARTEQEAAWQKQVPYAYAVDAVRQGYIVFAPDKRGFGETVEPEDAAKGQRCSCPWHTMCALMLGMTEIGLHVWDNQRLIDYVLGREDCTDSIACLGVSGGGQATLWLAAMDERVKVAVVSGHLGSVAASLLDHFGCACNTVPGLLRWARKGDVAGLIAPRPLLVESASRDQWYSRAGQLASYGIVKRVYQVAGVPARLDIDLFDGPHQWSGRKAWGWLERWMTASAE